jgi:hypothetical protein
MTEHIRRQLRRRSAVEPVMGMSKPGTAWAAIFSSTSLVMPSMPCSPPPVQFAPAAPLAKAFALLALRVLALSDPRAGNHALVSSGNSCRSIS